MERISAVEAAKLITPRARITTGGFGSCGHPDLLTRAIEDRFMASGEPMELDLIFAAGQGDRRGNGLDRLAHRGLLRRITGGYWSLAPALGELVRAKEVEAHNWPQGVVSHLFRAIAAGQPGLITRIGLHTFIDPRVEGGVLTDSNGRSPVSVVEMGGEEFLFYPGRPIDFALIRGTRADSDGNITLDEEVGLQDVLSQALAAHNCGGTVIVQVKEVVPAGTLPLHAVRIPGVVVDYVVVADPDEHWQTYGVRMEPAFIGQPPTGSEPILSGEETTLPLVRRLIAARAFEEVLPLDRPVINLGIGIPEGIADVAARRRDVRCTLTVESGAIGGHPAGGLSFGASYNPIALLEQPTQFDLYDGGAIDLAFLGMGELDPYGNVNVGRLGDRINGVGGFVNISQSAKRIVFCGTFTTGGLEVDVNDGRLRILREGRIPKVVESVQQLCFNAAYSRALGQTVRYITERAVLELRDGRLTVVEIAPGIDIGRHLLLPSRGRLVIADDVKTMNAALFNEVESSVCRNVA